MSLLESIINFSEDAIISKTLEGIITSWNKGAEKIFGYHAEEIIGMPVSVLIPPHRINEELEIIRSIKNGEHIAHYETERITKAGATIYISLTVSPLKNRDGVIVGASKIARDITEQKLADTRLRKNAKEIADYKYALDESSIVAITDQKGIITYVNDNFCRRSQYSREELLGRDHGVINSGFHPASFFHDLWATIAGGKIWKGEIRNRAKDGSHYWVSTTIVPFLDEDGRPYQYVAIRYDITEQKRERELHFKTLLRYQQVAENILDGLMIDDLDGKVVFANDQFLALFGLERGDIDNMVLEDYVSPEYRERLRDRHNRRVAGEDVPTTFEYQGMRKDGTKMWLEVRVCKVYDNNVVIGTQSAIRDVTDRKQAADDIARLNQSLEQKVRDRTAELEIANKELETFSYSIAHDLRSPLHIIQGYVEMLKDNLGGKFDPEKERITGIIVSNARRMGMLIDEILNLARVGRKVLSMRKTDMNALLDNVLAEQMELNPGAIKFTIAALHPAICDSSLIRQVWLNFISNAVKYSRKRDHPSIDVGSEEKDGYIIYSIADNGAGFDMRFSNKLFGVFQRLHKQTEFEGIGVGLALVQRIIVRHGGRVWATSEVNNGATFYFSLPTVVAEE